MKNLVSMIFSQFFFQPEILETKNWQKIIYVYKKNKNEEFGSKKIFSTFFFGY